MRRSVHGQGAALPADLTAALDMQPTPKSGGSPGRSGEADDEALAPG